MNTEQKPPLFKREITIGDAVSLVFALAAVLVAYGKLDTRITVVEAAQAYQAKADDTYKTDTKITLRGINDKLDRIIEKGPAR